MAVTCLSLLTSVPRSKVHILLLLLFFLSTLSYAQTPPAGCPTFNINGPSISPGRTFVYPVVFDDKELSLNLEYQWTVRGAELVSGQGKRVVEVHIPEGSTNVYVAVKIIGLPPGCPNDASEAVVIDLAPEPTKLDQFTERIFQISGDRLDRIVRAAVNNPSAQLFILSGHINGRPSVSTRDREREVVAYLARKGIPLEQVSLQSVYAEIELIQVWIVPAGARLPGCVECNILRKEHESRTFQKPPQLKPLGYDAWTETGMCPSFWINVPDIEDDLVSFTATIDGKLPENVSFLWMVKGGDIVNGQGTTSLTVRGRKGENVSVAFEINGLPKQCKNSVYETAPIIEQPEITAIDEFDGNQIALDKSRSERWLQLLAETPGATLFVIKYFPNEDSRSSEVISELGKRLLKELGEDRFQILTTIEKAPPRTRVFIVPSGAEFPEP